MNEFKESQETKAPEKTKETDLPKISENSDWRDHPPGEMPKVYDGVFKSLGLVSDNSDNSDNSETSEKNDSSESNNNETGETEENPYSEYLEKGEDGKYYDKETGKSYDSVAEWKKDMETLLKKYEGTAKFCEEKAAKEWAKYKNADNEGKSESEKWNHYKLSQDHYERAKICREKADNIRQKLGLSKESVSDKSNDSSDSGNKEKSAEDASDALKS